MHVPGFPLACITAAVLLLGAGCNGPIDRGLSYSKDTTLLPPPSLQEQQRAAPTGPMSLMSSAFQDGQSIPLMYACEGQDFSPPVSFENVPTNAVSLALIMRDADAAYDHWTVFNIPPAASGIPAGDIPPGLLGATTNERLGYKGPCPPQGPAHRYVFTLYALDTPIALPEGTATADISAAIQGHVISSAVLNGTFVARAVAQPPVSASSTNNP